MINIVGLSHINIVVDNIADGINFYKNLFQAVPYQMFPNFKNNGFSKSAGFLKEYEKVRVSIAFLKIPNTSLILELMEYHNPRTKYKNILLDKDVTIINGVKHVALLVNNIEDEFNRVQNIEGVCLINQSPEYKPFKIDNININEFIFFDNKIENNKCEKEKVKKIISNTKYFYFLDKYGVQWEFEQGHVDLLRQE